MATATQGPIHAYIVPSGDAHQSEYPTKRDSRREFISKFTGSCGTAIITIEKAALWTDGRYHLQASSELDATCWQLMKDGLPDTPTQSDWLKETLKAGNKVGADPFLLSHDTWKNLSKELRDGDISLVAVEKNLIDIIWEDNSLLLASDATRPPQTYNKLISLGTEITGKDWTKKVSEVREEMKKKKVGSVILTDLADIAWLLNLRGSDVEFNPVFMAYCVVSMSDIYLFVDKRKLTPEIEQSINAVHNDVATEGGDNCVRVVPYESIVTFIKDKLLPSENQLIWISGGSSEALNSCVPKKQRYNSPSPVTKLKALKNEVEVQNMKNCHVRDGAALCEYLCWLEKMIAQNPEGHPSLFEATAADYLEECRKKQDRFVGLSFPSISSSGPNGAIIHYRPEPATQRAISKNELYLIDSGAQYYDGTTDVTRTVHFGEPSSEEQNAFTYVLQGHIQLEKAVFPHLTKATALDVLARQYLWSKGLDYLHGTGHGVGMFLNVHEGPSYIAPPRKHCIDDPGLDEGYIVSNEPGYYEDGSFGIRIESLLVVRKKEFKEGYGPKFKRSKQGSLQFETLTLVPIQHKMINHEYFTEQDEIWLDKYHERVLKEVGGLLDKQGKKEVKEWLIKQTRPWQEYLEENELNEGFY